MPVKDYTNNVFFNCPFDDQYVPLRNAMVFVIFDCGFTPRCSLEEDNGGHVRFDKIQKLIDQSQFGIHDISRTELDDGTNFPRFNMPLELGVFIGAKKYGQPHHRRKNILILDKEQYRYQAFISDIAGHDIRSHECKPEKIISHVRDWLNVASGRKTIPGGKKISARYELFMNDLPAMLAQVGLEHDEMTYNDYANFVSEWLREYAS
jgi:hypothetical protein